MTALPVVLIFDLGRSASVTTLDLSSELTSVSISSSISLSRTIMGHSCGVNPIHRASSRRSGRPTVAEAATVVAFPNAKRATAAVSIAAGFSWLIPF